MQQRLIPRDFYEIFIRPRSDDPDSRRREYILNVLLSGLAAVATAGIFSVVVQLLYRDTTTYTQSVIAVPLFGAIVYTLLWLSRKGYSHSIATLLLCCVFALATYSLVAWSFFLPMTQLLYVFSIVLSGVLFRARAAILTALLASIIFASVASAQTAGIITADIRWLGSSLDIIDAVGCIFIFIVIGLVTWLANSEIDRALDRARTSEASLEDERNNLEIKVQERTQELEEEHLTRVMELQRFAELGKLSASLLHDIANPLTVASLNVEQLNGKHEPELVKQVEQSLRYIERYVESARKQLLTSATIATFSPKRELRQVTNILSHHAKQHHVTLQVSAPTQLKLTGDPIKFSQLTANLILNAIESYEGVDEAISHTVEIELTSARTGIKVLVRDHGKGLTASEKRHMFRPFYTTKTGSNRNMGIGLSLVKQMVEKDFNGKLQVESKPAHGTTFTALLQHVQ